MTCTRKFSRSACPWRFPGVRSFRSVSNEREREILREIQCLRCWLARIDLILFWSAGLGFYSFFCLPIDITFRSRPEERAQEREGRNREQVHVTSTSQNTLPSQLVPWPIECGRTAQTCIRPFTTILRRRFRRAVQAISRRAMATTADP